MFIYDVIEFLMNIDEAIWIGSVLMKCLKFQIALFRIFTSFQQCSSTTFVIDLQKKIYTMLNGRRSSA